MHEHGTSEKTFALASVLMRRNALRNPRARFRGELTADTVLASKMVSDPLRLLEICAVSDGAAVVILGTEAQARRLGVPRIEIAGAAIATGQFGDPAFRIPTVSMPANGGAAHTSEVVGAVQRALELAGATQKDVDVLELADNTAWHVLAWPEMLGFVSRANQTG